MKLNVEKFFLCCLAAIAFLSCTNKESIQNTPPNIILIVTDDQGWGDLSFHGNRNIATPNIDKLATSGVSFNHFYVSPVCSPTRAEILTGRYHPRGGIYSTSAGGERLDLDETTIAEIFKNAGYATAAYGKWHNGMQPPYHPNARGFDDFYGFCSGHWGNYFNPMLEHNGKIVQGEGFIIDDLTNHGLNFLEKNQNKPFFLYLPFNTPHSPMQVPEKWWTEFENRDINMRHRDPEKEDINFTRAALAMCENIDWNVGRIVEKVDELNLANNTIIIYMSDNGPNSWRWNSKMKGKKGSTDEGGVRSPFFMKWPGRIEEGITVNKIAASIDLLPTLCDLAGIEISLEKPLDGVSLKPLTTGKNTDWPERLIYSHWNEKVSVRSQKYRLDNDNRLFDMENDPGQLTDISHKYPEMSEQLTEAKNKWQNEVLTELDRNEKRPFTIGHPDFIYNQLPARDGVPYGNIERSNRYPNCTFFTNWTSKADSIAWDINVLADGDFEVEVYYTCPENNTGSVFELSFAESKLTGKITEPHNPSLKGMKNDRVERMESYVKDFKPLKVGTIHLPEGKGKLTLRALEIPGEEVMDVRLLMLKRL